MRGLKRRGVAVWAAAGFMTVGVVFASGAGPGSAPAKREADRWRRFSGTTVRLRGQGPPEVLVLRGQCRRAVREFERESRGLSRSQRGDAAQSVLAKLDDFARRFEGTKAAMDTMFWRADVEMLCGRKQEAADALAAIVKTYGDYPQSVKARIMLSEQLLALKRPDEAVAALTPVADAGADGSVRFLARLRYRLLLQLAMSHHRAGDRAAATKCVEQAIKEYPKREAEVRTWSRRRLRGDTADIAAIGELRNLTAPERVAHVSTEPLPEPTSGVSGGASDDVEPPSPAAETPQSTAAPPDPHGARRAGMWILLGAAAVLAAGLAVALRRRRSR